MSYSAEIVADWFVAWAGANDADLSNLKLQKLLYYGQGYHLGLRGSPLFDDPIEAWSHGPVVASVYHRFKQYGSGDIPATDEFDFDCIDSPTTELLIRVWNTYGGFGAWRLRNMTHSEAPWKDHFTPNEQSVVIPQDTMRAFFGTRV